MAVTNKRLCKGTLSDTNATLYQAPTTTGNTSLIKTITICNKTASDVTVTIKLAGIGVFWQFSLTANTSKTETLNHILEASELIEGFASSTSAIDYYISGREVT